MPANPFTRNEIDQTLELARRRLETLQQGPSSNSTIELARERLRQLQAGVQEAKPGITPSTPEKQNPFTLGRALDYWKYMAGKTAPGMALHYAYGTDPEKEAPEGMGLAGRIGSELGSFFMDVPTLGGSLFAGKLAGKGIAKLAGRLGPKMRRAVGAERVLPSVTRGAATLGTMEAIKSPLRQAVSSEKGFSWGQYGKDIEHSVMLGAGFGAAGLLKPALAIPAEFGILALGPAILEGRRVKQEDIISASVMIVGFKTAHKVAKAIRAGITEAKPSAQVLRTLKELDPGFVPAILRIARMKADKRQGLKYTEAGGIPTTYRPVRLLNLRWSLEHAETGKIQELTFGSFLEAGVAAGKANRAVAPRPEKPIFNIRKMPLALPPPPTEVPAKAPPALTTPPSQPGFGFAGQAAPGTAPVRPGRAPTPAQELGPTAEPAKPVSRETGEKIVTTPRIGLPKALEEVAAIHRKYRDVIDGETPDTIQRVDQETGLSAESPFRASYSFRDDSAGRSAAKELKDRLPEELSTKVSLVKTGTEAAPSAKGLDIQVDIGTDAMAESIIRFSEQAPARATQRTADYVEANPRNFTPEENLAVRNYRQIVEGQKVENLKAKDLAVGDEFTIGGEKHRVAAIDPKTGKAVLEDDITLELPKGKHVAADAGSLKAGGTKPPPSGISRDLLDQPMVEKMTGRGTEFDFGRNIRGEAVTETGAITKEGKLRPDVDRAAEQLLAEKQASGQQMIGGEPPSARPGALFPKFGAQKRAEAAKKKFKALFTEEGKEERSPFAPGVTPKPVSPFESAKEVVAKAKRTFTEVEDKILDIAGYKSIRPSKKLTTGQQYRRERELLRKVVGRVRGAPRVSAIEAYDKRLEIEKLNLEKEPFARYRLYQALAGKVPVESLPEAQAQWVRDVRPWVDDASKKLLRELMISDPGSTMAKSVQENIGKYLHEWIPPGGPSRAAKKYASSRLKLTPEQFMSKRDKWIVRVGLNRIKFSSEAAARTFYADVVAKKKTGFIKKKAAERGMTHDDLKNAVTRGQFEVISPFTESQRIEMNFVRDPMAAAAVSHTMTEANAVTLQMFRHLRRAFEVKPPGEILKDPAALEAWAKENKLAKITGSPRKMGVLLGKYVPKFVAAEVNDIVRTPGMLFQIWNTYLSTWKEFHVAWNPATIVRNYTGNFVFSDLVGNFILDPRNWKYYHRGGKQIMDRGKKLRYLVRRGTVGSAEYFGNEVRQEFKGVDLSTISPDRILWRMMVRWRHKPSQFYNFLDQWFKISTFEKLTDKGMSWGAADRRVNRAYPNFAEIPRWAKFLRTSPLGAPFLSFNIAAAKIYARAAIEHPIKLAKWHLMPGLVTAYATHTLHLTKDEREMIDKTRSWFQPIMPWGRDKHGAPLTLDLIWNYALISEYLGWFGHRPGVELGIALEQPIISGLMDTLRGRERFNKKLIWKDNDDRGTKMYKGLSYFVRQALPLPGFITYGIGLNEPGRIRRAFQGTSEESVWRAITGSLLGASFRKPYVKRSDAFDRLKHLAMLDEDVSSVLRRLLDGDIRRIPYERLQGEVKMNLRFQDLLDLHNDVYRSLGGPSYRAPSKIDQSQVVAALGADIAKIAAYDVRLRQLMVKDVSLGRDMEPGDRGEMNRMKRAVEPIFNLVAKLSETSDTEDRAHLVKQIMKIIKNTNVGPLDPRIEGGERPNPFIEAARMKRLRPAS